MQPLQPQLHFLITMLPPYYNNNKHYILPNLLLLLEELLPLLVQVGHLIIKYKDSPLNMNLNLMFNLSIMQFLSNNNIIQLLIKFTIKEFNNHLN
mmetsp:Transcript_5413/g.788  ORF Transcript_5413/g.788 Transcript_5413/m.788 type:complete len:95 (-) Transcript_5413:50-334(-)